MKEMRSRTSTSSSSSSNAAASTSTLSSRSAARVHPLPRGSACLSCRARRVRCDEGQPCSACIRNAKFLKTECNCVYGSTVKRSSNPNPKNSNSKESTASKTAETVAVAVTPSPPPPLPIEDPDKLQRHMAELERTIRANLKALKTSSASSASSPSSNPKPEASHSHASPSPPPPSSATPSPELSYYSYSSEDEDSLSGSPTFPPVDYQYSLDSSLPFVAPSATFNYFPPAPTAAAMINNNSFWPTSSTTSSLIGLNSNPISTSTNLGGVTDSSSAAGMSLWGMGVESDPLNLFSWKPEDVILPPPMMGMTMENKPQPSTCYPPDLFSMSSSSDPTIDYFNHHLQVEQQSTWSEQQLLLEQQQQQLMTGNNVQTHGWSLY